MLNKHDILFNVQIVQQLSFHFSEGVDKVVVYAAVKIGKKRNQARKQRPPATEMVEYGQIKMVVNPDEAGSPEIQG